MSFLDEVHAVEHRSPGPRCVICKLLDKFDDREDIQVVMDDVTMQSSVIARALGARGEKVSPASVSRHRRRECSGTK